MLSELLDFRGQLVDSSVEPRAASGVAPLPVIWGMHKLILGGCPGRCGFQTLQG